MTYEIEKPNATQLTISVRVPWAELDLLLKPAAEKISSEFEIDGFRKGHAPYEVVKQKVGDFKILEEAARLYIEKNSTKILEDVEIKEFKGRGVEPIGTPQVAITKLAPGQDLEYKITLSFLPALELPDYKAIAKRMLAGKKIPEVTEQEMASAANRLRESRAKLITVNRGAQLGDRVEIDFSAKLGGVELEGGNSKNHPLIIGKGQKMPGFEDELIGLRAGEEKSFTLDVSSDHADKKIAGKPLEFKVEMKLVQKREVPEFNDEFAKSLGSFSSVAEMEKSVRDGLTLEHEAREKERIRMAMLEAIAAKTTAEIPEPLMERELDKMTGELEENVKRMGLKLEDYLNRIKKTAADLKKEWRQDAERRVKIALVLREIARIENIQPSGDEIQEAVNRTLAHQGINEEDLKKLDRGAILDYHRGVARNEKVLQWLEGLINE